MKGFTIMMIILFSFPLMAQDYSTSVSRFLLLGGGARAGGLGGAYTAVGEDASTITWNPGGLGRIKSFELSFMHMKFQEAILQERAWIIMICQFHSHLELN